MGKYEGCAGSNSVPGETGASMSEGTAMLLMAPLAARREDEGQWQTLRRPITKAAGVQELRNTPTECPAQEC